MKALLLAPAARSTSIQELPSPTPGNGEILIRIHAVALNPVDALYVFHPIATQDQRVIGTDFAGVVAGIGPDLIDCPDLRTKVGTRVAGFHQGGEY